MGGGVTHFGISAGKGGQNMEAIRGWVWIISGLAHLINSQTREDASISNRFLIDTSCESCRLSFMSFELGFRDRE